VARSSRAVSRHSPRSQPAAMQPSRHRHPLGRYPVCLPACLSAWLHGGEPTTSCSLSLSPPLTRDVCALRSHRGPWCPLLPRCQQRTLRAVGRGAAGTCSTTACLTTAPPPCPTARAQAPTTGLRVAGVGGTRSQRMVGPRAMSAPPPPPPPPPSLPPRASLARTMPPP
jgi:hypothetical protein